jgi:hypothetical protein
MTLAVCASSPGASVLRVQRQEEGVKRGRCIHMRDLTRQAKWGEREHSFFVKRVAGLRYPSSGKVRWAGYEVKRDLRMTLRCTRCALMPTRR